LTICVKIVLLYLFDTTDALVAAHENCMTHWHLFMLLIIIRYNYFPPLLFPSPLPSLSPFFLPIHTKRKGESAFRIRCNWCFILLIYTIDTAGIITQLLFEIQFRVIDFYIKCSNNCEQRNNMNWKYIRETSVRYSIQPMMA